MPDPNLVARIAAGGNIYENWTSVSVTRTYSADLSDFAFSCAEVNGQQVGWDNFKLKPGDRAQIFLAGVQVIDGNILVRNAGYDANQHQVIVQGSSLAQSLFQTSADPREYKGYTIDAIARALCKPVGVNLVTKNLPPEAQKAIREFRVHYGETAWEAIERLARSRGVFVTDDAKGNLVMSALATSGVTVADFVEGENILAASAMLRNDTIFSKIYARGQDRGTDQKNGAAVAQVSAVATNPNAPTGTQLIMLMEEPGDTKDAQARANREMAAAIATTVEVVITVPGWKRPDGQLWDVADHCTVQSPRLFPTQDGRMELAIRQVTFSQTAPGQTTTTLNLCLPNALTILTNNVPKGPVDGILSGVSASAQPQVGSA